MAAAPHPRFLRRRPPSTATKHTAAGRHRRVSGGGARPSTPLQTAVVRCHRAGFGALPAPETLRTSALASVRCLHCLYARCSWCFGRACLDLVSSKCTGHVWGCFVFGGRPRAGPGPWPAKNNVDICGVSLCFVPVRAVHARLQLGQPALTVERPCGGDGVEGFGQPRCCRLWGWPSE